MIEQYDIGEVATLRGTFVNNAGVLANPVTLGLTITSPSGVTTVLAIGALTNVSTGVYEYDYTLTENGVVTHTWIAAGNNVNVTQTEYLLVGTPDHDGPCDSWIGPNEVFACRPASTVAAADRDYSLAQNVADAASRLLYLLSDRRYPGICRETVRPCRRRSSSPAWWSASWNASWGLCGCTSGSACGCAGISEIRLGGDYPVLGIQQVRVDGAVVPAASYRVDDGYWLVRTDDDVWPSSQDLGANPATDDDTFDVTYWYGRVVPADGKTAAGRLASELYAACGGGGDCALPLRVRELAGRGETVTIIDPQEFLSGGLLGLYEVDAFLTAERYGRGHLGTVFASPELTSQVRRTG